MSNNKSNRPVPEKTARFKNAHRGLISWIFYFAGSKKGQYIVSVFFALLSVACCIAPYFIIARIVQHLLARFWDVDKGTVTLDGKDVRDYSMDNLMKNYSFVLVWQCALSCYFYKHESYRNL